MKFKIVFILLLCIILVGCAGKIEDEKTTLKPIDMLDKSTQKIYSLGDEQSKFEEEFGVSTKDNYDDNVYLSGMLKVAFTDGKATKIEAEGGHDRFEFCNFTFSDDLTKIRNTYTKDDIKVDGYDFYVKYYDEEGRETERRNCNSISTLTVRNGDLFDLKDGQFMRFSIELYPKFEVELPWEKK